MERQTHSSEASRPGGGVGCITAGMGCFSGRSSNGGGALWSPAERRSHINVLEIIAGTFAVQTFARERQNIQVLLKMDNTSAVSYVNHLGGTRSSTLSQKAKELWLWCLDRGISLSAEFLPEESNTTADFQSRLVTSQ